MYKNACVFIEKITFHSKEEMKILVTGADGLLGSNLVRELLGRNYEVTALVQELKVYPTLADLPIKMVKGDLLDPISIHKALNNMEIVIHCAANTSMFPPRQEIVNRVNLNGVETIISACKENQVKRLIYVGTANSFGSGTQTNLGDETRAYNAEKYGLDYMDSKYKAQKIILEEVANGSLDAVVVNPTFMIGPYDSRPSSGEMLLGIYFKKVPGYTLGGKNFVAVKDVATAIANAITMGKKGECYILGNENLSYQAAFDKISKIAQVKSPRFKLSTPLVRFYGKANSILGKLFKFSPKVTYELAILASEEHYYSCAKARKELNMPQTPIETAIADCFSWFKENNYLTKK